MILVSSFHVTSASIICLVPSKHVCTLLTPLNVHFAYKLEFDRPEVTLCCWQNIKIQLLSNSVYTMLQASWWKRCRMMLSRSMKSVWRKKISTKQPCRILSGTDARDKMMQESFVRWKCGCMHVCACACYWAIKWSWFAQVNALCNLSWKVAAATSRLTSEQVLFHAVYNNGSWT